jgi:hypothetical protein
MGIKQSNLFPDLTNLSADLRAMRFQLCRKQRRLQMMCHTYRYPYIDQIARRPLPLKDTAGVPFGHTLLKMFGLGAE